MPPLLTARERLWWLAGFVLVAALLVLTRFASLDSDSVRYATLSAHLTELPVSRWIAPVWWGMTTPDAPSGYFLEHPAGLFLVPAALGRLGMPPVQAAYIFGVAAGLFGVVLTAKVVSLVTTREAARATLVLLQVMPVAFIFRIRDNQEYPMLVCLMATLAGLHGVSRSWRWLPVVALGVVGGLLVKGVFVTLILLAAALWIVVNPSGGRRDRQIVSCAAAIAILAVTAVGYDVWYAAATGGPFWRAYWARQLGPLHVSSPLSEVRTLSQHIGFYVVRLLFHPAPWSLVLIWVGWKTRALPADPRERLGAIYALVLTVATIVTLSAASRFAERYAFSCTYVVGAAGSVVAFRSGPALRRWMARLDAAVPAFPAVVWVTLVVLRLAVGPLLPRLGG
jgi:4-amino-4-deoxy-L-arabinose transferase-like glycosyltransferase